MRRLTALLDALLLFVPASVAQVQPGQAFAVKVLPVAGGDGIGCESFPDRH